MSGWVAGAVVVGGVIGAVGSNMAANKQAGAQKQAAQTQQNMFNTITGQEKPYMDAGYGASTELQQLMGLQSGQDSAGLGNGYLTHQFNSQDFQNNLDPGYQWQLQQGQQALRNSDTPGVGALSGAALKDLVGFNQGMASTGYQNAFNRYTTQQNNIFGRLSDIANRGQNAASNTGQAGTQLGTGIAQAQAGAGASRAGGILGASNSLAGGVQLASMINGNSNGNYSNNYSNPSNLGGSTPTAPAGGNLTYDSWGNITGSAGGSAPPADPFGGPM